MALTFAPGPLSMQPGAANYVIDGPPHRILLTPTPKRVRVRVGEEVVLDSTRAVLLHESNLLPRYYVPVEDVRAELLVDSQTTTHCPFKGDATYSSVHVGDRRVEDLLWRYEEPVEQLPQLAGLVGLYLEKLDTESGLDAVLEEDQVLLGHPRDPFHRVDAWPSSRNVEVRWTKPDGSVVMLADSTAAIGVFETCLPARWYLPVADVATELLVDSLTTSTCPYKGVATYRSLADGPADVAWGYQQPLGEALALPGHLSFDGAGVTVLVDGQPVIGPAS